MKVLQINSHYDQGGAARIVACIHRNRLANKEESYVAYGRGRLTNDSQVYYFGKTTEIYYSALMSRVFGWNGRYNKAATKRLIKIIEEVKPDLLHIHVLHGYYLNFELFFDYVNSHKIPCVWTFHDCHAFVGNCGYFFDCRKWEEGCKACPYLKNYPTSQFFDHTEAMWKKKKELFTAVDNKIIVTPSDWLTEEAKKSFFGKYDCRTVRNGIDTKNTFYPRDKQKSREKYGYSQDEKIALGIAVGYSDPRKGAKYIMEAARNLGDEVKFILIGWEKSNDNLLQGLTNVETLSRTENVEMLAEYYSMADVFVLPSLAENYATVSLESMACGTPVVGFNAGGIPEQLTEGKGIVVPVGDGEAFTKAIREAVNGEVPLLRGEDLAGAIREENSVEHMVAEYKKIYEELLNKE